MVKVALTGVGFMGKTHLGVYQRLGNVEIAALCDVRKANTEITQLEAGGNIKASSGSIDLSRACKYTDYESMLKDGGFDFVDICLPTYLHAEYSIRALEAGFHVFCEKPMALTAPETAKMLKTVEKTGKLFSVGQCLRFWPAYVEVKRLIDSGKYGKAKYAEFARFSAPPTWGWENWLLDGKRSGNAALDLHVHDVDMLLFLFGKPDSVRSSGVVERDGSVSHIASVYSYPGLAAASTGGWICSDSFGFNMRAFFVLEGATIELDSSKEAMVTLCPKGGEKTPVALPEGDGYYHELADFVAGIAKGGLSGTVTGASAAESVKLALTEIESVKKGKELRVRF
jgi:predicted dehydrogenase